MSYDDPDDLREKRTFLGKYGFLIGIFLVLGVGAMMLGKILGGASAPAPRKAVEMVMIKPLPPAPPPPPPPPQPPQPNEPKEQMMEQTPVDASEAKPDDAPDPSPALGTNVTGNGPPDGFGLGKNTGGRVGGTGGGGKSGSRFGWYAAQVIKSISAALSENPRTRNATFDVKVKVWADVGGRITRAKLMEPTGQPEVDAAIRDGVLVGHQLQEPPPDGMPMPIVMRLSARRPN